MVTEKLIPASEWFSFTEEIREGLSLLGAIPTNDVFLPLWHIDPKIWVLVGGRGGGKSVAVADRLIEDCRTEKYFKCYYGRKVFETVHHSCFETLIACIKKRNLQHEFKFSEADNSQMIITHYATGNSFIPFGSDRPEKIKSITDPTHIWCEEFPEFTYDDFKEIFPTLRTERGKRQLFLSLNAYAVFPNNWVVKMFDPEYYTGDDEVVDDLLDGFDVQIIKANYYDNHFIDQDEYKKRLWFIAGGNQIIFDGLANGTYGVKENKNPWLTNWEPERIVKPWLPVLPGYPVYLSFDFNNDPFACTAYQFSPIMGTPSSFIHVIKEFSGKVKIEEMCAQIKAEFPNKILYVTGDRSGRNEDLGRNQTLYEMIAGYLGLKKSSLKLNNTNLEHADSRIFCNVMLANYPNFYISKAGCPNLITQCQIATTDPKKPKPSHLLKDRGIYKMDEFDSWRYFLQTFFHDFAKNKYLRIIAKPK